MHHQERSFFSERRAQRLDAASALGPGQRWDLVCDTRTPAEFGADRVPGAVLATMMGEADTAEVAAAKGTMGGFAARIKLTAVIHRAVADALQSLLQQPRPQRLNGPRERQQPRGVELGRHRRREGP